MRFTLTATAALAALLALIRPVTAGPSLLLDSATGQILYAEDLDNQWHPASLTKIMTAYLTFEAIRQGKLTLESKVACSEAATLQAPSKVGLPIGAELTVDVALQAVIVKSANDVSIMLAEAVAGSEPLFVGMMNETAKRLGMDRTNFVNANGLPAAGQVTTARDLARLALAVVKEFPQYAHYWSMTEVTIGKQRLGTHNGLLKSFDGADGLKTGFICDSGYNVIASATRNGRRLMAIVLGSPSGYERKLKAEAMLEYGFQSFDWKQIFNPGSVETMPFVPDAKSVLTMRSEFAAWDCGLRRRPVLKKAKERRAKPRARAKGKKGVQRADDAYSPSSSQSVAEAESPAPPPLQP